MNKHGQVWIETVLYTLIGIALIGVALGFIMPKINQAKDRALVEQTIQSLNILDERIITVSDGGPANSRRYDLTMKRGELIFNGTGDEIIFTINDLSYAYSEPGISFPYGRIRLFSEKLGKNYKTVLTLSYNESLDITYSGSEEIKKFTPASVPYQFLITNRGNEGGGFSNIDIEEISGG